MTPHATARGLRRRAGRPAHRIVALALLGALSVATAQAAVPNLSYSAYAQTYGYLNVQYSSPFLGDVSFTLNGASDYKYFDPSSGQPSTGVASINYSVAAGQGGGNDPLYDLITNYGQYGFNYNGRAEVTGAALHTAMRSSTVDSLAGTPVDYAPNTSQDAYSMAQWSQGLYIGATAARPTGSYGALVVGITLDGQFPALSDPSVYNSSWANLQASSTFSDLSGVSYESRFYIGTSPGDTSWTGQRTVFKKLLFQYGTPFTLNLWQYVGVGNNGDGDFFHTGRISQIELPYQAVLVSGAEQAGLGSVSTLYGTVFNSATADAQNTNWDFGNNGGGFTPNVPEPQTWTLWLAGLAAMGSLVRRRR